MKLVPYDENSINYDVDPINENYKEEDSTRPARKIHKVVRAKSKKKKKKRRKKARRRIVGIPHEELGDNGGGSIFGGEGNGGGNGGNGGNIFHQTPM